MFASRTLEARNNGCSERLDGQHQLTPYSVAGSLGAWCPQCFHDFVPENPVLVAFRGRWEQVKQAGMDAWAVREAKVELLWMKRGRGLRSETATPEQKAHAERVLTLLVAVSK